MTNDTHVASGTIQSGTKSVYYTSNYNYIDHVKVNSTSQLKIGDTTLSESQLQNLLLLWDVIQNTEGCEVLSKIKTEMNTRKAFKKLGAVDEI